MQYMLEQYLKIVWKCNLSLVKRKNEISGYDIVKSDATVSATTSLKVYDVILAGVCV